MKTDPRASTKARWAGRPLAGPRQNDSAVQWAWRMEGEQSATPMRCRLAAASSLLSTHAASGTPWKSLPNPCSRRACSRQRISQSWMAGGSARTRIEVGDEVREPAVKHTVTLVQLQRWANGATRSPAERIKRERMRQLLAVHSIQGSSHER